MKKRNLHSNWFINYRDDDEEATKYEERLNNSTEIFDSLREFIAGFQRDSKARERKISDPNWHTLLIRENGYAQALEDLKQILPKGETDD